MPRELREPTAEEMQLRAMVFKKLATLDRMQFAFSTNINVKNNHIEVAIWKVPVVRGQTRNGKIKFVIPTDLTLNDNALNEVIRIINEAVIELTTRGRT